MKREIVKTADGSSTIFIREWKEHYHSIHGAIQEAQHVFIQMGLFKVMERINLKQISIMEIGFGTGLNALVTWKATQNNAISIDYTGIEAYPVSSEEILALNYADEIEEKSAARIFAKLHKLPWEQRSEITENFSLTKQKKFFHEINDSSSYDLIYFDAFGARVQPELWTEEIFEIMYKALRPEGILVTYSAKGSVRRAMQQVGFQVEKLPGPPGKREMLRAAKV